jgi:hypothetical protein
MEPNLADNCQKKMIIFRKKDVTREMNLAAVLVCIVVVFLICHMPRLLLNLIDMLNINDIIA